MPTDADPRGQRRRPLTRADLARIAGRLGVPVEVVEKDYVLSYVLAGIVDVPALRGLCFKGGTALKKIYFGDYRFSEDLDFSAVDGPRGGDLDIAMGAATRAAETFSQSGGDSASNSTALRSESRTPPGRMPSAFASRFPGRT